MKIIHIPLLAFFCLIAGCKTTNIPTKPEGHVTLLGETVTMGTLLGKKGGNIFIVEIDGEAREASPGNPVYLPHGHHRIGFWAATGYRRSEIIRFDFTAKEGSDYYIDVIKGGEVIEVTFIETTNNEQKEVHSWKLPTVYQQGSGIYTPLVVQ
ncbi:hypothetical protein IEN85_06070 [Pelagicoccus sp. NFK12]|uniref:Uncharacterized protein n=1 Tax=Pelagicoccus enzymogenes TaxID=2773457 RepID=A0A927IEH5_9BACT|nr:hypothetical protein [Pelagicoccus enzymogenes]MBD5779052.1 hypothetical protein [Pelagicoccus enzymogenes]